MKRGLPPDAAFGTLQPALYEQAWASLLEKDRWLSHPSAQVIYQTGE